MFWIFSVLLIIHQNRLKLSLDKKRNYNSFDENVRNIIFSMFWVCATRCLVLHVRLFSLLKKSISIELSVDLFFIEEPVFSFQQRNKDDINE